CALEYVVGRKSELFHDDGAGGRRPETGHANHLPVESDIALPAHDSAGLYGQAPRDVGRQNVIAIGLRLLVEEIPRRHADGARTNALRSESLSRGHHVLNLASGTDENDLRRAITVADHV